MSLDRELVRVSPAELTEDIINRLFGPVVAPAGAVVGPTNNEQQQAGVISVMAAGLPVLEKYNPTQWVRAQLRCLAGTHADAEVIGQRLYNYVNGQVRIIGRMKSTDQRFLILLLNITAGPSMHYDSDATAEVLLFAEILLSTDPL